MTDLEGNDEEWCVQRCGRTPTAGGSYSAGPEHCGDVGRFVALLVDDERRRRRLSKEWVCW